MFGSGTYESALRATGYQGRSPSRSFGSSYGTDVRRSEENIHQNSRQNDETPSVKLSEVVRMITEEVVECVKGKVKAAQVTDEASLTTKNVAQHLLQWTTEEKLSQAEFVNDLAEKVTQASVMFMNAQSTQVGKSRMIDYIMAGEMSPVVMEDAFTQVREGLDKDYKEVLDNLQKVEVSKGLDNIMSSMEECTGMDAKRMVVFQLVIYPYSKEMARANKGYCKALAQYKEQKKELQRVKKAKDNVKDNDQDDKPESSSDEDADEMQALEEPEWTEVDYYHTLESQVGEELAGQLQRYVTQENVCGSFSSTYGYFADKYEQDIKLKFPDEVNTPFFTRMVMLIENEGKGSMSVRRDCLKLTKEIEEMIMTMDIVKLRNTKMLAVCSSVMGKIIFLCQQRAKLNGNDPSLATVGGNRGNIWYIKDIGSRQGEFTLEVDPRTTVWLLGKFLSNLKARFIKQNMHTFYEAVKTMMNRPVRPASVRDVPQVAGNVHVSLRNQGLLLYCTPYYLGYVILFNHLDMSNVTHRDVLFEMLRYVQKKEVEIQMARESESNVEPTSSTVWSTLAEMAFRKEELRGFQPLAGGGGCREIWR
jgi:ribosomal protein L37AE/L43A